MKIMQIETSRRKIGMNFLDDGNAEMLLWAPYALTVLLLGAKLPMPLVMEGFDHGYWSVRTDKLKAGDSYWFEMWKEEKPGSDNAKLVKLLRADPAALFLNEGIGEHSTAFDTGAFDWSDHQWRGIPQKDYIIYELHTGTFTQAGDFKSIEDKLDHLVSLGITAIELMPVAQFPGSRNWGYDGVYPFAVQNSYGGPAALQHLVNSCHSKGLAVILDVVYNHMGPEGNYFGDFGPYFTEKYLTPWGKAINFDDAGSDGVRHYFIENALMWFRDFHIDALRLDAVHAIKDFGAEHILAEIKRYTAELSLLTGRRYHLFAELDLNDNRYINSKNVGGYGMDGQWVDEFHHALRVAAGQQQNGYYSDFNGVEHLARSYQRAYVYDGQYSSHRDKTFGQPAEGNPGEQFIVFSQNHDQVGNRMLGERTSTLVSSEMLKLLAGAVFCSPFLPLIFMGEEYGEEHPFMFFISHADPTLVDEVRKGRKGEFAAFQHADDPPDPQDEKTFQDSKLDWERVEGVGNELLGYYKALIVLRKTDSVLSSMDRNGVKAMALAEKNCLMLTRDYKEEHILVLMNFSDREQQLRPPVGCAWNNIWDSSSVQWGGPSTEHNEIAADGTIVIKAESIIIFKGKNV